MWGAIASAVASIFSTATAGNMANNASQVYEYQNSLAFSQQKDLAFYGAYQSSNRAIMLVAVAGVVALIAMVYLIQKNK